MAKIGSILQETRLSKGLTLDSIADETNIGLCFLSKLENDDYTGFPGEPYIIGFIRNYSEYLGLDAEALVKRYRANDAPAEPTEESLVPANAADHLKEKGTKPRDSGAKDPSHAAETAFEPPRGTAKTPESVVSAGKAESGLTENTAERSGAAVAEPAAKAAGQGKKKKEALPETHKPPEKIETKASQESMGERQISADGRLKTPLRTIVLGILAVLIIGTALLWILVGGRLGGNSSSAPESTGPMEYKVEGGDFQKRLYPGDSLLIPFDEDVYRISLGTIGETVVVETPFGAKELRLGESAELDPDANEAPDILLALEDFQKDRPASGALLKVSFLDGSAEVAASTGEVTVPQGPAPTAPAKSQDAVVLRSTRGPYPFIVQVSFRGNCLFRYEADRKEWVEKYYTKGESININVTNALTLWSSNAQAVKLTVQASGGRSVDLEIGAPGEIAVKRLAWSRADSATWTLTSSELD